MQYPSLPPKSHPTVLIFGSGKEQATPPTSQGDPSEAEDRLYLGRKWGWIEGMEKSGDFRTHAITDYGRYHPALPSDI
jgi:Ni/Co efflux regulator RcnB